MHGYWKYAIGAALITALYFYAGYISAHLANIQRAIPIVNETKIVKDQSRMDEYKTPTISRAEFRARFGE